MGSSRFWLKVAHEKSKCVPHEISLVKGDRSVRKRELPVGDNDSVADQTALTRFNIGFYSMSVCITRLYELITISCQAIALPQQVGR